MNIEKIKNYNQKMLAVFGTIAVIAAAVGLISLLVLIITELVPNKPSGTNALLSDDKVEQLKKDSLIQQIISYDSPRLVDTLNLIYLIPVNVKTLDKEGTETLKLVDAGYELSSGRKYRGVRFYGSFNNLIIYDYKNRNSRKICDYRLIGTDLSYTYFEDEIIIVFTGAERDTDGDKTITLLDFKSLFVYSLKSKELRKISRENSTVSSFNFIEGRKDILVTYGYDRNKNNEFDTETEPTYVEKYDYIANTLVPIIDGELERDIQKIIDKN